MKRVKILLLSLFISITLFAQKPPIKFGKISKAELEMDVYSPDSSASAVVLCDYGTVKFEYMQGKGFVQRIERQIRVKIFKKEGYKWAKTEILLNKKADNLSKIKAYTYNKIDGKTIKTKLESDQIFKEHYNKYWDITKFEMPAVQEGSVIDIKYSILCEYAYIRDWYFQKEIPVALSEYHVFIPEYYYFKRLEKGYFPITEKTKVERTATIAQTTYQNNTIRYQETQYTFKSKEVPAFNVEDFITCKENYLSGIKFELGSVKWPDKPIKNYSNTWPAIGKNLMKDSDFGGRVRGGIFISDRIRAIKSLNLDDEQKINMAVNLIRNRITWNGINSKYSFNITKAWDKGEGTSGDINLLLTAVLRKLDLDANPVILSTRSHGMIHPAQIILDQFNYVIASVKLDDQIILIDATKKTTPIGVLPEKCLNDKGRLINKTGGEWVDLKPTLKYKNNYSVNFEIDTDGVVTGNVIEKFSGYAAIAKRNSLLYYNTDEEFIEKYQETKGFEMTLDSISDKSTISKPLTITYNFENENLIEKMGDLMLINPLMLVKKVENPFKMDERFYPVDYSYPHSTTYMATINIPSGYSIEDLPKQTRFVLPNKSASFTYSIQNLGDKIIVVSKFDIKKIVFLPDEYQNLKEFYNQLIDLQDKKIVLKKI